MRRILLLAVLAVLVGLSANAQTKVKRLAKVDTYGIDNIQSQLRQLFYDKNDSLAFSFSYNVNGDQKTLSDYLYQFYDNQLRHVSDSTNLKKTYYTYDEAGHIVKIVNWSNYNNPNYPDVAQDSTLYFYNGDRLDSVKIANYNNSKQVYVYGESGRLDHIDVYGVNYSDNYKYEVTSRIYYRYDANGNNIARVTRNVNNGETEAEDSTVSKYIYNEQNQLVGDTIVGSWTTTAHKYEYDADGDLLKTENYNFSSSDNSWSSAGYVNRSYGNYSSDYVATGLTATPSETEPTTVDLKFASPADVNGLDGYKVLADGVLLDSVFTTSDNIIRIPEQSRGGHAYRILPVYSGAPANVSDEAKANVEVVLKPVRNLHFTNKEYTGNDSYGSWRLTFTWEKPEPSAYKLTGYRYQVGNSGYATNIAATDTTVTSYDYGYGGDTTTIYVWAVYSVGTSDPETLAYDTKDHTDQVTAHYHVKTANVTGKDGKVIEKRHYLYTARIDDYNSGEDLYTTVGSDANGNVAYRYSVNGRETKKWNQKAWKWDDYKQIQHLTDANGLDSLDIYSIYTDGKWNVYKKIYTFFNDPDNKYNKTGYRYVTINGNDSTVVNATHYEIRSEQWGDVSEYDDSLYNAANELTGKRVYKIHGYDANNAITYDAVTDYSFANNEFTPVSRILYTNFNDQRQPDSTEWQSWIEADWQTDSILAITDEISSKEYHRTHTPEGDFTQDVDDDYNPIVTWPTPVRTKELTNYVLYLDDVEFATVDPDVTTYTFKDAAIGEDAKGTHSLRIMALYNGDESCVSSPIDIEIVSVANGIKLATATGNVVRTEVYDLQGRRVNSVSDARGQLLIIKRFAADGTSDVRKVFVR